MDAQNLFEELVTLTPAARAELITAFQFAAAATAPSRDEEDGLTAHEREQAYRTYLNLARWLRDAR